MPKHITSLIVCVAILATPIISASDTSRPISANEFFFELTDRLDVDLSGLEHYTYCSPQIAYLVEKGYITAYQANLLMVDEVSTASLIDRAFLFVDYFDRPMAKGSYGSIIERVAKETGLVDESFDFSANLSRIDAMLIMDKLANGDFKRVRYSHNKMSLKYTIDDFYDMSLALRRVIYYVDMLPNACICEFERQHYTLHIVEDVKKYHPHFHKHATAFVDLSSKEIFVMRGFEKDVLHEFAHLMLSRFPDKNIRLRHWYKSEGIKLLPINGVQFNNDMEEYFANIFSHLVAKQNDKEYILNFKERYPITYSFVMDVLLKGE